MVEKVENYITGYIKGKTPKMLFDKEENGCLPYLSPDYLRNISQPESYAQPDSKLVVVNEGEVIVLWDGSNAGEILISKKGILASTMTLLEFDENEIDKNYFGYSFQQLEYILKAKTAGSGIPHADKGVINKLNFYKPSLPEQASIANILSKVDEAIESVKKSIEAAEKLKKSLMQNLLTGRMKLDGTLRKDDEFYVDDKFGKVPIGWDVKKVKDFGEVITGKTPPTEEPDVFSDVKRGFMFITPGDVGASKYIEQTERYVSEKGIKYSYRIPKYTICVICIGSTIGKIGITTQECCTNQQITSIVINNHNYYEYFYYAMLSRKEHLKSIAGINATPQINKSEYSKYKIICPISKEEQINIAQKISAVDKDINDKQNKITALERLKKSLMQNLLTGKVRVGEELCLHNQIRPII